MDEQVPWLEAILAADGHVLHCPALNIESVPENQWLHLLPPMSDIKQCVFTSANAVSFFFSALTKHNLSWPPSIYVIAIGEATANALYQEKITVNAQPEIPDSENLLLLPALQNIAQQSILLIKGIGGRTLLEETLSQRGANLIVLPVYQRTISQQNDYPWQRIWRNDEIDLILITSEEAMQHLFILFGERAREWLINKPCLVISPRLAQAGSNLGLRNIQVCRAENIMHALHQFNKRD